MTIALHLLVELYMYVHVCRTAPPNFPTKFIFEQATKKKAWRPVKSKWRGFVFVFLKNTNIFFLNESYKKMNIYIYILTPILRIFRVFDKPRK